MEENKERETKMTGLRELEDELREDISMTEISSCCFSEEILQEQLVMRAK